MKVGLIAYRGGNVRSIRSALETLGAQVVYSDRAEELAECAGLIFPGVGAAKPAAEDLQQRGLWGWLPTWQRPFLGICLGMQLLGSYCEEGDTPGLGLFLIGWQLSSKPLAASIWAGTSSNKSTPTRSGQVCQRAHTFTSCMATEPPPDPIPSPNPPMANPSALPYATLTSGACNSTPKKAVPWDCMCCETSSAYAAHSRD